MKIVADKTENCPTPHALSIPEVRCILKAVPDAWIDGLTEIHLSNSIENGPRVFFSRFDGKLTIHSRGCTSVDALQMVLSELAVVHLGLTSRHWHRLSKTERARINRVIQPILEKLAPLFIPEKKHGPVLTTAFRRVI